MVEEKEKEVSEDSESIEEEKKAKEAEEETEAEEDEELFADDEEFNDEEGNTWEKVRDWAQDNLRVILSVLIVALIAVGIYNYSQKPEDQSLSKVDQLVGEQEIANQTNENSSQEVTVKEQTNSNSSVVVKNDNAKPDKAKDVAVKTPTPEEKAPTPTEAPKVEKTGASFKVVAIQGDGRTHLARKALAEYLAGKADAGITKEHKIYIEDYLQKHSGGGKVRLGESQEFSETLISDAIGKAKQLNDRQLQNLKRYSARVASL